MIEYIKLWNMWRKSSGDKKIHKILNFIWCQNLKKRGNSDCRSQNIKY